MTVPSTLDWNWLGKQSLDDLARFGSDPEEVRWIGEIWAWLRPRLPNDLAAGLPESIDRQPAAGPPSGWIPVLAIDLGAEEKQLTFLQMNRGGSAVDSGLESLAIPTAFEAGWSLVGGDLIHDQTGGQPGFAHEHHFSGTSAAGSAFILGLTQALETEWPADHAITAGWQKTSSGGVFQPVQKDLMKAKIRLAAEWGYRHLWVCEGQEGLPDTESPIQFHFLPRQPRLALAELLPLLSLSDERSMLRALVSYDRAYVNNLSIHQSAEKIQQLSAVFVDGKQSDLVRKVAHDLRSRAFLHAGETLLSEEESQLGAEIQFPILPDDWVGYYLRWEQPLHHAILAMDLGRWGDSEPEHQELDELIESLSGDSPRQTQEIAARFKARNVRARRWDFLGRFQQDPELLKRSAQEYLSERPFWPAIIDHDQRQGIRSTTLRRQENQVMDPLLACHGLTGRLPTEFLDDWQPWPEFLQPECFHEITDPFDRAYALRWWSARGVRIEDAILDPLLMEFEAVLSGSEKGGITYPLTLLPEALLRTGMGSELLLDRACQVLLQSRLVNNPSSDLMALLGCRAILLSAGRVKDLPDLPQIPPGKWEHIVREIITRPEHLVARCPY